jgi:uncharacterized protein DUF3501
MAEPGSIPADHLRIGTTYEEVRSEARRGVAELKRPRRVSLGRDLVLVFENRDTLRAALEETLRAERITEPQRVAAEAEAFSGLAPNLGELVAVLYLAVSDPADRAAAAARLDGVERAVYLEVGGRRIAGGADDTAPDEEAPAAFAVRFHLDQPARDAWLEGAEVRVGVEHPAISVAVDLDDDQRKAVAGDL